MAFGSIVTGLPASVLAVSGLAVVVLGLCVPLWPGFVVLGLEVLPAVLGRVVEGLVEAGRDELGLPVEGLVAAGLVVELLPLDVFGAALGRVAKNAPRVLMPSSSWVSCARAGVIAIRQPTNAIKQRVTKYLKRILYFSLMKQ
jgi:hypothetical protein